MTTDPDKVIANIDPVELAELRRLAQALTPTWWIRIEGMLMGAGISEAQAVALVDMLRNP